MSQGRSTPCIGDKLIQPLIGNPYNGYINPYYWVDDPGTYDITKIRRPHDPMTRGAPNGVTMMGVFFCCPCAAWKVARGWANQNIRTQTKQEVIYKYRLRYEIILHLKVLSFLPEFVLWFTMGPSHWWLLAIMRRTAYFYRCHVVSNMEKRSLRS